MKGIIYIYKVLAGDKCCISVSPDQLVAARTTRFSRLLQTHTYPHLSGGVVAIVLLLIVLVVLVFTITQKIKSKGKLNSLADFFRSIEESNNKGDFTVGLEARCM